MRNKEVTRKGPSEFSFVGKVIEQYGVISLANKSGEKYISFE